MVGLRHGLLAAVLVALVSSSAFAKVRLVRVLDWRNGLPASFVGAMEEDPEGFLWIVTSAGVFRYDGTAILRETEPQVYLVRGSAKAGDPLFTHVERGGTLERRDGTPVLGPDGETVRPWQVLVATDGALWIAEPTAVRRRAPDGVWSQWIRLPEGEEIRAGPHSGRDGSLLVMCTSGLARVTSRGDVEWLASLRGVIGALDRADGSTVAGCFRTDGSRVYEIRSGAVREIDRRPGRFMALAERAGVLWVAYDQGLVRIAADEPSEFIEGGEGLPGGGALLVDHEGSLWVGTGRGLAQLPEPDTVSWNEEVTCHARELVVARGSAWMSSWGGLVHASLDAGGTTVRFVPGTSYNVPCADRRGDVWTVAGDAFLVFSGDAPPRRIPVRGPLHGGEACAPSGDGGMWMTTGAGVYHLGAGEPEPRLLVPTTEGESVQRVLEDSRGNLWISRRGEICSTDVARAKVSAAVWTCTAIENELWITDLAEMPSGAVWATTFARGVWRSREGGFEPVPASKEDLVSSATQGIAPSPSGGVWILGEANFLRVRERADLPGGWEVLERVGLWQGLPTSGILDVVEVPDGTLWVATNMSLVRIPASARHPRLDPPPIALVDATVDGRALDFAAGHGIELPYRRNRLELRFAALSYRDPSLIRYRTRSNPDEPWSAPTTRPSFRFVDLPARRYRIGVQASLDGERWSDVAKEVSFVVLRPWWATWWFRSLLAAAVAATIFLAYRLRVAYLLRLERQRMRIAMDLHDEVGSGLGSIGVLAGLLSRPDLPGPQRAELSVRIGGVARELSHSLGDIVWSLRAGSGTLGSLWAKVLDRAQPLYAAGSPRLHVRAPEPVPDVPLSLAVRRNVSLIAIEALHNAARHAGAGNVTLSLDRAGDEWAVSVTDDGNGIPPEHGDATRRGLGLEAMRARAEEMGGVVRVESPDEGGTRVVVHFRAGKG